MDPRQVPALRERWLTTAEAALYLGKTETWMRNHAKRWGIPRVKIGQQYRYRTDELDAWLRTGQATAGGGRSC